MEALLARELWTVDQAAEYLGTTAWAARKRLQRAGIPPLIREAGHPGKNLFDARAIRRRWPSTTTEEGPPP